MASRCVMSSDDLTPEVLGSVLGIEVRLVEVRQTGRTLAGGFAFVRIDGLPRFVKWTRPESRSPAKAARNRRECRVLSEAGVRGDLPVPRCHAAIAHDDGTSTIVLEDLSEEWAPFALDTPRWLERSVDALASLHAAFLDNEALGAYESSRPRVDDVRRRLRSRVADMTAAAVVPSGQLAALNRIVEGADWSAAVDRVVSRERITLLHGDAHVANFLYQRTGERAMLIDWELIELGVPTDDVAIFLGFHGPNDLGPLLDRYRSLLGMPKDAFADDWRGSVLRLALAVTAFWQNGMRGSQLRDALSRALSRVDALE